MFRTSANVHFMCSFPLDDKLETVRLLLDNGSMRSFITREISRQLKLPVVRKETLSVYSFGAKQATEKTYNVVKVIIENRDEPTLNIEIEALETDQITATNIPVPSNNISKINKQLKGLKLADCYEFRNNKIVILVGADYYYDVVLNRIKRLNDKLVATETLFGWCILGKTEMTNTILGMKIVVEEKLISDDLTKFWELENLGIETNATENISDDVTLKEFESGISFSDNRYSVRLPWKPGMKEQLQDNRTVALKRFRGLQSKFLNDPFLFNEYRAVLEEHKSENIIESVTNELKEDKTIFYLPHMAVIREDKTTSKLRIVFDASSHAKGQLSLNDCLHIGTNLNPDIFLLLVKFRENRVAFTAVIKQAFLQIQLDEEDRDVTRFLWNENPNGPEELIQSYRMTRVLFGVSSSPFLLAATIKHHLKRYVEKFPETCEMLNNSLYVDDLVSGRENVEQAFKTSLESVDIFKGASMILRKWQTNSPELRDRWKEIGMDIGQSVESKTQTLAPSKILGVAWNPDQDTFTLTLEILIQELWCLGLDWDEFFPKNLESSWNEWCEEVPELNTFSIPRYYLGYALQNEIDNIQIHCFSDSSKKAYGTVVYLRIALKNGKTFTNFVASKCRVAPLKTISLPRLELMGALLSARLSYKISKTVNYITSRYFWTDSSITYFWIKGSAARFKPFVKNRIKEIQKYTDPIEWRHCPGKDNPADLLSRGMSASELRSSELWWHGPPWLIQNESSWPKALDFSKEIDIEQIGKYELRKETMATHFEVVSDLTTDSFLASLRRFIARRSKPATIWSDNATNFKGAKNVLDILLKICQSDPVQKYSAKEGIEWKFIPPASPHFGGLWEANIKSMKKILLKVTKSTVLTFEELTTLVAQIEAVLNSRPLCPLSADPADLQPLTPGHFLVGAPLLGIPEPSELLTNISLSSRWSLIQSLKNRFWKRWSKEYLGELQARKKWRLPLSNLKLGQLVMLKEPSKIPMEWTLGRIEGIHPGSDGLVRVIRIRTSRGVFTPNCCKCLPTSIRRCWTTVQRGRDVPACQHQN
ncbi:integrase catalytic domain-containing protein [Trichonephila clavipes]|nr:integrase catalytic domain-containing protein [Trichonephila clavipes]